MKNQKNGVLSSKLFRALSRINSEGQSNMNSLNELTISNLNDLNNGQVNYIDLTIIIENLSEFTEFYLTICKQSNQEEFIDLIFTKELKEKYQLSSGKSFRLYKPFSQYSNKDLQRKVILCPYFIEILNQDKIDDVSQEFESLCETFKKNLDDSRISINETPEKKKHSPRRIEKEKSKEIEEKNLPNIYQNLSLFPIGDQNSTSITLIGVVQRVFRRKEPNKEEDGNRHIDYLQYHHTIIIQEVETKLICLLKIPFGEYDYWRAVFHGEGQILKFNCFSLVKRTLIHKKSPLYSIIRRFDDSNSNFYTIYEFHVQCDSTFDKQYSHQDQLENTQTDSQLEKIQKSTNYIKTEFYSIPDLNNLYLNIRVHLETIIFHVHFPQKCNQPFCILFVQDEESKELKTFAQINIYKKYNYDQLISFEINQFYKFHNLRYVSKGILEFDEYSSRKKSKKTSFTVSINNKLEKGKVGWMEEEFIKIMNENEMYHSICPKCNLKLQDSKCPIHQESILNLNLKILLTNNIILHLNHQEFKKIYLEQKNEEFKDQSPLKEILSSFKWKFIVYIEDCILNIEEKVLYNYVSLSKLFK